MSVERLVVVGASLAGLRAVEAARRGGYTGEVVLVGDEPELPYDRPPLSKALLAADQEPPAPTFRTREHLVEDLGVQLRLGSRAEALDVADRVVLTQSGTVDYQALVIATGSFPRVMAGVPAVAGVHQLRTLQDAWALRRAMEHARHVVVVGAGFIGAEVASAARKRGLSVVVVEAATAPLARAFGERMGLAVAGLHARHGTELRTGTTIVRFEGVDRVCAVHLSDGTRVPADLVVVGIGADPAVEWLRSSGLALDRGISCDSTLQTSAPGVYAAGDVARWHDPASDRSLRLETWTSAAEQGALAALNALGRTPPQVYTTTPYMWSDWYGSRIQFVGDAAAEEVQVVHGDLDDERVVALYRSGDRVVGALAINKPTVVMKYRAMIGAATPWPEAVAFMTGG